MECICEVCGNTGRETMLVGSVPVVLCTKHLRAYHVYVHADADFRSYEYAMGKLETIKIALSSAREVELILRLLGDANTIDSNARVARSVVMENTLTWLKAAKDGMAEERRLEEEEQERRAQEQNRRDRENRKDNE